MAEQAPGAVPGPNRRAIERLEQIRSGALPTPTMWATIPVEIVEIAPPRIVMEARADERHMNALGTVHGGFVATVLDTALGLAVYTSIGENDRHITVDLGAKMLRIVPLDEPLAVETELVHLSRSVGVSQGTPRDAAGVVIAHGTATCHVRRAD